MSFTAIWYNFTVNGAFSVNANILQRMEVINRNSKDKPLIESDKLYLKVDGKKYSPTFLMKEYELIARSINNPDLY